MIRGTYRRLSVVFVKFLRALKTLPSKKDRLNLEPHNPFAFTSSRASSSVVVELLTKLSHYND